MAITDASTFSGDLEFDSLTVMDFVAAIEDEFDIIISMNQQAEIETYGQLIDAVVKLQNSSGAPNPELLVNNGHELLMIVFCGLIGGILWNLLTWLLGLPSSSSHALFGGLIG